MADGAYGRAAEEDVRQVAAQLGVADFVYTVPQLAKGRGSREMADVLLISNKRGAVLQVKTREPGSRSEDGAAWIASNGGGEKAYRQGSGTRRQIDLLQKAGTSVTAFPVRTATGARRTVRQWRGLADVGNDATRQAAEATERATRSLAPASQTPRRPASASGTTLAKRTRRRHHQYSPLA